MEPLRQWGVIHTPFGDIMPSSVANSLFSVRLYFAYSHTLTLFFSHTHAHTHECTYTHTHTHTHTNYFFKQKLGLSALSGQITLRAVTVVFKSFDFLFQHHLLSSKMSNYKSPLHR